MERRKMYEQFFRGTSTKVDKELSWRWLIKSDLKVQTESLLDAAQEQVLKTNYLKFHIDKTSTIHCVGYVETMGKRFNT